jgi:hypothetical protein
MEGGRNLEWCSNEWVSKDWRLRVISHAYEIVEKEHEGTFSSWLNGLCS